jgi:hypothetical protein
MVIYVYDDRPDRSLQQNHSTRWVRLGTAVVVLTTVLLRIYLAYLQR